ncbi:MAG: isochorismatase family protein [Bacteroidetes bacterium]|nr:isochorismatase family protein [Bacteroidota bacterium]
MLDIFAQNEVSPDLFSPALLIIDIQNQYLPKMSEQEKKYALEVINGSIWYFRKMGFPIIRVYHSDIGRGPEEGTKAFDYPESIIIRDTDPKIHKHFPNAFKATDLNKILKENGCNRVFICGLSATACVLATYFGSLDNGYSTYLIRDGIMSHDPDYTNVIKDICESVSFQTMINMIQTK